MRREKGRAVENWNWQAHESKYGAESDISSEYEIISNYYNSYSSGAEDDVTLGMITPGKVTPVGMNKQLPRRRTTKKWDDLD